jgi:hypothetical protein
MESNKGYLPIHENAFEKKYQEWKTRDWPLWLKGHHAILRSHPEKTGISGL